MSDQVRSHAEPAWQSAPPPAAPFVPVRRAKPGKPVVGYITGDRMEGVWTHWTGRRSVPCCGAINGCVWCEKGSKPKWYGYLACIDPRTGMHFLAELTPEAVRSCPQLVPQNGIAGKLLKVYRRGDYENSSLFAQLEKPPATVSKLPAPCNVRDELMRLWGAPMRTIVDQEEPVNVFDPAFDAPFPSDGEGEIPS